MNDIASTCYHVFVEPFYHGICNIDDSLDGERRDFHEITQIVFGIASTPQVRSELDLVDRITGFCLGILLLIPLINAIVFAILEEIESPFLYSRSSLKGVRTADEVYLDEKLDGQGVFSSKYVSEPIVDDAEYQARRRACLEALNNGDELNAFVCPQRVSQFDLDGVLARFSKEGSPERLLELFDYTGSLVGRQSLQLDLQTYSQAGLTKHEQSVKSSLNQLFAFLSEKREELADTNQERAYKAQLRDIFSQIQDAHRDCVDQVLSQIETILSEVVASQEFTQGRTPAFREYLHLKAAYFLFKYKMNLIKQICIQEYPREAHAADLERLVKERLAELSGIQGSIFQVGAQFSNIVQSSDDKVLNICNIFLTGAGTSGASNALRGRREANKCNPEQFFVQALTSCHSHLARPLRNKFFLWMKSYFNFDDVEAESFIQAISEDPAFDVESGGDIKQGALFHLLEVLGIFQRR